jgi:serine phosphatase RsbU (regulator of sigma subunit)
MTDSFKDSFEMRRPPVILIVDDEAVVTQSLSALLELETEYRVLTYQSPAKALKTIQDSPVDLVISDFLMPEMNGLEFLSAVKRLYPDVPRIMLTGYADKENSIRAINEIGLFQYIEKPWDNDQLKLIINNALAHKSLSETLTARIHDLDVAMRERERLAERNELLSEELSLAQRLQREMLPPRLPNTDRIAFSAEYLPAMEVGGDFYDVIPLAGGKLGILVADLTGHGIQAALSTAVLKFAFSDFKTCDCSPEDIIRGMNRALLRALPTETFAAAMVLIIDMKTAECRFLNAGLPHPFLLHRGARRAERVIANGFILGVIDEELYKPEEEQRIALSKGDFLMVYTDGLSEVQNEAGELFDQSELRERLESEAGGSGAEISGKLITASKEYGRRDHRWDDITVFGIDLI